MKKKVKCDVVPLNGISKLWRIMRLTVLITLIGLLKVSANVYSQQTKLSMSLENVSLEDAFRKIEDSSNFVFFYNAEQVELKQRVSLNADQKSIVEILDELFVNKPIAYKVMDRRIVLFPKGSLNPLSGQQALDVKGKVTSTSGEAIPGLSVVVKGTTNGTITDFDGNFTLKGVPSDGILLFSFVGMRSQEVAVAGKTEFKIRMEEETIGIEEVVAVGYGVQKKVNLTGAVSQVTSEVLESRPVSSVGQALQGVIPNLNVSIEDGGLNTNPKLNVRGGTSFAYDSNKKNYTFQTGSPLVLVDGIEMDINILNPEDIASISVLKDAASAAIYGARAAYGVMLVTTKKGRTADKAKVTYSNSFQWNTPSVVPDMMDALTIQEAAIKAVELEGKSPSSDALLTRDKIAEYMANPETVAPYYMKGNSIIWIGNTDVFGEAVRDVSPMQKHNVNLSGGNGNSSYYGSIGFQSQDGLYKINTDKMKRYNVMLNVSSKVNEWITIDLKTSYNKSAFSEPVSPAGKGGWWTAMSQEPGRNINMPIKTPANSPVGVMYTDNILAFMDYGSSNKEEKEVIVLGASPTITPLKGWQIKGDFSYKSYNYNRKQIVPTLSRIEYTWTNPTTAHTAPSYVQRWKQHSDQYTVNIYTDYSLNLGKHNIYGLAGYNQEWYSYDYLGGRGDNILSPAIPVIGQTLAEDYAYDAESEWAIRGGFYRLTYNYNDKYLIESNGRYDGTSRFPKDRRFKFFNSFSGAWRITKEPFASVITPVVNELKLRASYGSLGNQNVANYIYVPSYGTIDEVSHLFGGIRPIGVTPPGLVDPDLTWETATTIDFGFDMTLYDRFDLTFDWYKRSTSDILVAGDKFPAVIGTSAPTRNSGEMKTTGWELTAKWRDQLNNGLKYDLTFVLSDYQSEMLKFYGNPNKLLSTLYDGMKMGEIWGYETVGIFQTPEEIAAAPSQSQISTGIWYPGDIQYKNLNDDDIIGPGANTLEDSGDRKIIGNSTPRFQFGLNGNASYKGFDLNLFFQGVGKRDYWIGNNLFWGAIAGGTGNMEVYNNSWTPERRDALYPAYKSKGANIQPQTKYMWNAAYIRLKNVTLGYSLPKSILSRLNIDHVRIYGSAYNIWEYSKLPDVYDPEMLTADYPMIRSVAFGLQVTF